MNKKNWKDLLICSCMLVAAVTLWITNNYNIEIAAIIAIVTLLWLSD